MKQKTIIIFSTTDWDAPQFGSRQQIAQRLARHNQVLYVEQPRALHSLISDRQKTFIQMQRWLAGGLRQPLADLANLQVYAPPPVLPIFYHPWTNLFSQRILKLAIRRALGRLGWQADIFWTYWANSSYLVGAFGEKIALYHCIDNFRASGYPLVSQEQISVMEETLCRKVDLVLTRTPGLAETLRPASRQLEVISGGVDLDQFNPFRPDRRLSSPPELDALPKPMIGLVGSLDDRLDVSLLEQVARRLPQVTLVLAGFLRSHLVDLSALIALPNVYLLPAMPHHRVPSFVAQFDVCLIPYLVNDYTREVSPLKLYEFLAMGKPVVATPLPYVCREKDHIFLARSAEEFVLGVEKALKEDTSPEVQAARRQAAEPYSWDKQVRMIEDIVSKLLSRA